MTLAERFERRGRCTGFTWLRLALAIGIFTFHSVTVTYGSADAIAAIPAALARLILPMFFALSGFLVAASLARSRSLLQFAGFRAVRLLPALAVVVLTTMLVLGPLVTAYDRHNYFFGREFASYLGNLVGRIRYGLPGVFLHNPRPAVVNGALWTIPAELYCYLALIPLFLLGGRQRRALFALTLTLLVVLTVGSDLGYPWLERLPTSALLLPFLAGVSLFAAADWLPCRSDLGIGLFVLALLFSFSPRWAPAAALPLAYATIWLGMRTLPGLPGDYSYGLYLAGYPLEQAFVQLSPGGPWWTTWLAAMPVTFACAMLLWHFVEKPALAWKSRPLPVFAVPAFSRHPKTSLTAIVASVFPSLSAISIRRPSTRSLARS